MRRITRSRRAIVGLGILAGALFGAGTAAAKNVESAGQPPDQDLIVGAPLAIDAAVVEGVADSGAAAAVSAVAAPAPPTGPPPPPAVEVTTTTAPASSTTSTIPRVTTTRATPTTRSTTPQATTAAPGMSSARSFSLSPASGPTSTTVNLRGGGCLGEAVGFEVYMKDPAGQDIDGDGGAAMPDGTWSIPFTMHVNLEPGRYTFHPRCASSNSAVVLFSYTPLAFTVTA